MDSLSPERRSWNMSRIRSKDTNPEKVVRSLLHRMGYRFRLHVRTLPGAPDIVLLRYHTVIFVNGCFWHRHANCVLAYTPKTRTGFWKKKLSRNVARQHKVNDELEAMGWRVMTVWECDISDRLALSQKLSESLPRIGSVRSVIE
jgi:DNA mismatch endonuclease (patch repair protein)